MKRAGKQELKDSGKSSRIRTHRCDQGPDGEDSCVDHCEGAALLGIRSYLLSTAFPFTSKL